MASNFTDFVLRLAEDPRLLAKFSENPIEVIRSAGLTDAEQAILTNPTPALISQAIINEISRAPDDGDATTVIVITYTYTRVKETTLAVRESSNDLVTRLRKLSANFKDSNR